ncbi:MAG: GDP-mannose 4,6-dehydratase [Thermoplasmata archaeon]
MANRTALITGITGQDGSYLADLLVQKGYQVYGLVRRLSSPNMTHLAGVIDAIETLDGDLMDQTSLNEAVRRSAPDEIYNLGAQSFVATSFTQPVLTGEITGIGSLRLLEAVKAYAPEARVYQASSSEMFGHVAEEPQSERTPFHPRSPYGVAKVYAFWASVNYREAYSMFVSNGILFNHESPRRGLEFVTRKISSGVAKIAVGKSKSLTLGNLDARRDWGYAPDYVDLIWRMLQHSRADDFVGATGEMHSVREFVEEAFRVAGIEDWSRYVKTDTKFTRPSEVHNLRGDASKAARELGWAAQTKFKDLVRIMVEAELKNHA